MTGRRVAGVVLAAGTSSRADADQKLLLPLDGGPVVAGPVRAALESGLEPVVVVTGHRAHDVRHALESATETADHERVRFVHNPRYAEGQGTSLARGLREVRTATDAAAAAVLLGDEPGLRPEAVRRTVAAWRRASSADRPTVLRARYRDRPGHPVVFPRELFPDVEAAARDGGPRSWLARNPDRVAEARRPEEGPSDVDTAGDYRRLVGEEEAGPTGPAGGS